MRNMSDIAEAANETNSIMTWLLGSIAGVSLLVRRHRHHEHHARFRN